MSTSVLFADTVLTADTVLYTNFYGILQQGTPVKTHLTDALFGDMSTVTTCYTELHKSLGSRPV